MRQGPRVDSQIFQGLLKKNPLEGVSLFLGRWSWSGRSRIAPRMATAARPAGSLLRRGDAIDAALELTGDGRSRGSKPVKTKEIHQEMEEDFANSPRRFSWAGRVRGWLGARRGGGYLRRDPKLAVYGARTRFGWLGRRKGSCGVGKSFIGLVLTPLAWEIPSIPGLIRPGKSPSQWRLEEGERGAVDEWALAVSGQGEGKGREACGCARVGPRLPTARRRTGPRGRGEGTGPSCLLLRWLRPFLFFSFCLSFLFYFPKPFPKRILNTSKIK